MTHKKIRIPRESANEIMRALGGLKNAIEFEDLTKDDIEAKKNFGEMIKRCDEMKKKIYDYNRICFDFHLPFETYKTFEEFTKDINDDMKKRDKKLGSTYFDLIENEVLDNDRKLNELVDSHSQIREDLVSLIEKKHVLLKAEELVRTNIEYSNFSEAEAGENGIKQSLGTNLNFMAGVVGSENEMKMKRMIFRISRGRAITAFYSLEINSDEYLLTSTVRQRGMSVADMQNDRLQRLSSLIQSKDVGTINTKKKIFTIIFTGSEENILLTKILKVCEVFQASRYPVPKNSEVRNEINKIEQDIADKKTLMTTLEKNLQDFCLESNKYESKRGYKYSLYKLFFEQEKMVYTTLNKCIVRDTFVDGHVWIPNKSLGEVNSVLQNLFKNSQENKTSAYLEDLPPEDDIKPPTYISLNEFTSAFQLVVDTFGIPRYREINPGYFTIITFPFLFGVMYGDIGHGLVLLIFGIYLCVFNEKISKSKSILKPALFARYFLVLMGFFAVYCGFLYNDFLSIPFNFKSCYKLDGQNKADSIDKENSCSYNFGLDPVWYMTSNELTFVNSLKMKLSVILGVFQMLLGIILKGFNAIFDLDFAELIFVFFPQLILMLILFGYMDFLIFAKWATYYEPKFAKNDLDEDLSENYFAPDIKSYLMNIFLKGGKLPDKPDPMKVQGGKTIESDWKLLTDRKSLENLHAAILGCSIFCIIIMLLPKMFINFAKAKKKYSTAKGNINKNNIVNEENELINEQRIQPIREPEEPVFSNFFVESAIETIEFVLGTVSNTASYLRLWALSLAHSQLAVVFLSKIIILIGNNTTSWVGNGFLLVFAFPIFAGVTALVLLFMDMMECFLHTLRLHWVEFQNKFYKADGYQFQPFCFSQNLVLNDEEFSDY